MAGAEKRSAKPAIGFVLDHSIVMAWSFEDEVSDLADAVLVRLKSVHAIVPMIWPLEVVNALLMGEKRKRSTEAETTRWIGILDRLPIVIDDETNTRAWSDTLALARSRKLSAYDAAYLELAIRRRLPLATLDAALSAAAVAVGIELYDPTSERT